MQSCRLWAVIEGVNELGWAPLPLLDRRGGRDINKSREASTRSGRGGCSNVLFEFEQPPRLCRQWLLRNIFFLAQPPLLSRRGNGAHPNSFTTSMTAPTVPRLSPELQTHRWISP